eukprot:6590364-Pyramimonas_sp.AAC.1
MAGVKPIESLGRAHRKGAGGGPDALGSYRRQSLVCWRRVRGWGIRRRGPEPRQSGSLTAKKTGGPTRPLFVPIDLGRGPLRLALRPTMGPTYRLAVRLRDP